MSLGTRRGLRLLLLAVTLLAGCRSASGLAMPGSGAVLTSPADFELGRLVLELEPRVERILGERRSGEYSIAFGTTRPDVDGETTERCRVVVSRLTAPTELDRVVAHELVHVHAVGRWANLPRAVEEGLAHWVAALATGRSSRYEGPPANPYRLAQAVRLSSDAYDDLPDLERVEVAQAAAWLASVLLPAPEVHP